MILGAQLLGAGLSQAQSSKVIGIWSVEVTFGNGQSRSLRFEARESGKGSFSMTGPRPVLTVPAGPSVAGWTQSDQGAVIFSGPVQFPLGNVGLERGTLVLKGTIGAEGAITGEALFFAVDQDWKDLKAKPSKSGSFKATRAAAG